MSDYGDATTSGAGGELPGTSDPYQQYGAPVTPPTGGPPPDALAGFWIRLAASLLDGILLAIVGGVLTFAADGLASTLVQSLIGGAYFTFLHSTKAGQSLGQRVCGIRVVDIGTGGQVQPGSAAVRWLMSYVSAFALLIGYLWMLWDPQNQTWHDKVANTLVVYSRSVPPPSTGLFDR
jgi:uncharacterized RDD family membrane protein YckC